MAAGSTRISGRTSASGRPVSVLQNGSQQIHEAAMNTADSLTP
jgi:hypothetical protein